MSFGFRRAGAHVVIAVTLATFVAGVPPISAAPGGVSARFRAGLAALGLCQPEWKLFGPNVHKTNTDVVAEVTLGDGSRRRWTSPSFRARGLAQRFREGQLPKFFDNLRRDKNRSAWRPFTEWVARTAAPRERVTRVTLARRYVDIPPPSAAELLRSEPPAPAQEHVFYERLRW